MTEYPVCEWLRAKFLNSRYSINAEEIREHVKECKICKEMFRGV
jgi:hypothetical protein